MSLIVKHRAVITGNDALIVEIDKDDFVVITARGKGEIIIDAREARAIRDVLNRYLDPIIDVPGAPTISEVPQ